MPKDFEQLLAEVSGKVRRVRGSTRYELHSDALLPWWNKAEGLRAS